MTRANQSSAQITSRHNPLVQRARAVRAGKDASLIFIEGMRLCAEALQAGLLFEVALFTAAVAHDARGAKLLAELERTGTRAVEVSETLLASIADTKSPQGLVLLAQRPKAAQTAFALPANRAPLVVIMHGINNPANAGAMLRVAEAAGATGVIATAGTTDLFAPKALRGAMGSAFRLPLWTGAQFADALAWCNAHNISTVATDPRAPRTHTEFDWTTPHALIMGAEAAGLSAQEAAAAAQRIRIPMRPPVESLNVTSALAVVLYEAMRQREKK